MNSGKIDVMLVRRQKGFKELAKTLPSPSTGGICIVHEGNRKSTELVPSLLFSDSNNGKKCFQFLLARRLCPFSWCEDLAAVMDKLIATIVYCCNSLYLELKVEATEKLQQVHNAIPHFLSRKMLRTYHPIAPFTNSQVHFWSQIKALVIIFKIFNGLGPGYIREDFCIQDQPSQLPFC